MPQLNLKNNGYSGNQEKPSKPIKPVNTIQYINTNRTPKEEMELQHQLAQSNLETRQREQHAIEKSNGNQIKVTTHTLK